MGKIKRYHIALFVALLSFGLLFPIVSAHAQSESQDGQFSVQVTPSPLVFTAKPGVPTVAELKIRNGSNKTETLKIEPRSFHVGQANGEIQLDDTPPAEVTDWLTFDQQVFTIAPGAWYTEKITFSPPASAGFSYSFVLHVGRAQDANAQQGVRALKGSVAVFTLINIDRPGATKKLEITEFGTSKNIYEYLPVTFTVSLRNTGNTILQPYGNIFVQRGSDDQQPIATLPFNEKNGYILPDTTRTIESSWDDGFPVYKTTTTNGQTETNLTWDWSKVNKARMGKYTAKLVAVYNDGARDVPLQAEIQFWVLPWKFLLAGLVVFLVFAFGIWSMISRVISGISHKTSKKHKKSSTKAEETSKHTKSDD